MGWYFIKPSMFEDETVGPISDRNMLALAYEGKLNGTSRVLHPQHSANAWVSLSQVPMLAASLQQGEFHRRVQADEQRERKQEEKEAARLQRDAEKQRAAQERLARQPEPHVVLAEPIDEPAISSFRCPYCQSLASLQTTKKVSSAGWVLFILCSASADLAHGGS